MRLSRTTYNSRFSTGAQSSILGEKYACEQLRDLQLLFPRCSSSIKIEREQRFQLQLSPLSAEVLLASTIPFRSMGFLLSSRLVAQSLLSVYLFYQVALLEYGITTVPVSQLMILSFTSLPKAAWMLRGSSMSSLLCVMGHLLLP